MADTTDKPASSDGSTDETKPGDAPLDDKDLGQEDHGTGESHETSESQDDAPSQDSEGTEDKPDEDDTTSDDVGGEDDEDSQPLLTPEEIAKLPPELKKQHKAMQAAFTKKMQTASALVKQARAILRGEKPAGEAEDTGDRTGTSVVDSVLRRRNIDPKSLKPDVRASLDLVAEVAQEAAGVKAQEAVSPLLQKDAVKQVEDYFGAHPERKKYRQAMGKLDAQTGEKLTMDQLYFAVAGKDISSAADDQKDQKLRKLSKGNAESTTGTPGGSTDEGDIFDEIATAGGHGNSVLM